ncbi:hypothetical protein J6590_105542, partial [Homalodisca vitripennis]
EYEAIASFNEGNLTKCALLKQLGESPGSNCGAAMKCADDVRIRKADKSIKEIEKKVKAGTAKIRLDDLFEDAEDPDRPSYFDDLKALPITKQNSTPEKATLAHPHTCSPAYLS